MMISANRLLLQRLALQRISGSRQQLSRSRAITTFCWNSNSSSNNGSVISIRSSPKSATPIHVPRATFFWNALFGPSTTTDKQEEVEKRLGDDDDDGGGKSSVNDVSTDAVDDDSGEKKNVVAPPEETDESPSSFAEMSSTTTDINSEDEKIGNSDNDGIAAEVEVFSTETTVADTPISFDKVSENASEESSTEIADEPSEKDDVVVSPPEETNESVSSTIPEMSTTTDIISKDESVNSDIDVIAPEGEVVSTETTVADTPSPFARLFEKKDEASVSEKKSNKPTSAFGRLIESKEGVSDKKDDVSAAPAEKVKTYGGLPLDKVIRTGFITHIDYEKQLVVVIQDEKFRKIDGPRIHRVFIPFLRFQPDMISTSLRDRALMKDDVNSLKPVIHSNRNVQFQAREHTRKNKRRGEAPSLYGFNLKYEGGEEITMMHWENALVLMLRVKAGLGFAVYDILSKASSSPSEGGNSEKELKRKVNTVIEMRMKRIEWARNQIGNKHEVSKELKTRLGEDMYDLLTDIANVDNIQKKADFAYFNCVRDMKALGIDNLAPEEEQEEEARGFKDFTKKI